MDFNKRTMLALIALVTMMVTGCSDANEPGNYQARAAKAELSPVIYERSSRPPGAYYRAGEAGDDPQLGKEGLPRMNASRSSLLHSTYSYESSEQAELDAYRPISELMDAFWIFHSYRQWPLSAGAVWSSLPAPSTKNGIPDVLREEGLYWNDYKFGVSLSGDNEMELARFFEKWIDENRVEDHKHFRVDFQFARDVYRGFNTATNEIVFHDDLFSHTDSTKRLRYVVGGASVGFLHDDRELVRVTVDDEEAIESLNKLQGNVDISIFGGLKALHQTQDNRVPGGDIGLIFEAHYVEFKDKETGQKIYGVQL